MIPFTQVLRIFTFASALLLGTSAVRAVGGGIQDNGAFFSEPARSEASRVIADVEKRLKKAIVVETFKEVPESAKNGGTFSDKSAASQFFQQWAGKQARMQNVNGIYILLVKQPSHLQVVVGNDTLKKAFTAADRETLVSTMLTRLRAKQNDAALLDGVNFIASTMGAHAHGTSPASAVSRTGTQDSAMGWVLPVLIGGAGLWLVFRLLGTIFGGRANPTGEPQGAGGGGFGRSLLGGLFGAAAGMWMYNQFFGSTGHAASPTDSTNAADSGGGDSGFSGQDTDYTSSGGGFGDDSGGGFGGGDFGGGDSGGGDF